MPGIAGAFLKDIFQHKSAGRARANDVVPVLNRFGQPVHVKAYKFQGQMPGALQQSRHAAAFLFRIKDLDPVALKNVNNGSRHFREKIIGSAACKISDFAVRVLFRPGILVFFLPIAENSHRERLVSAAQDECRRPFLSDRRWLCRAKAYWSTEETRHIALQPVLRLPGCGPRISNRLDQ